MPRHAQPLRSQQLRVTIGVTRTVTVKVICVFHTTVTVSRSHSEGRTMRIHQEGVEQNSTVRPQLRKLRAQLPLAKFTRTPSPVEGLESLPVKTPSRLMQVFQVSGYVDQLPVII